MIFKNSYQFINTYNHYRFDVCIATCDFIHVCRLCKTSKLSFSSVRVICQSGQRRQLTFVVRKVPGSYTAEDIIYLF